MTADVRLFINLTPSVPLSLKGEGEESEREARPLLNFPYPTEIPRESERDAAPSNFLDKHGDMRSFINGTKRDTVPLKILFPLPFIRGEGYRVRGW